MLVLFEYMLKISACYAVIYLFYWFVLRRLTNYKSNRFYFLVMLVFTFIIPLLQPDVLINPKTISGSPFINYIPSLNITHPANNHITSKSTINISIVFLTIFIGGIVVCFLRFIMQLMSIRKITSKACLTNITSDIKLYHLNMDIVPFSFANAVYVNRHKHTLSELEDIIKHESVHVNQLHTIDIMLAEFVCILNWYNPFIWLIKHAVKQNLEFLADDAVINDGTDRKSYQYLLLKVTGYSPSNIISSFNLSSLKQRIYMMNKTKTSQKHLLKLFFVLPLLIITMFAFRDNNATVLNATSTTVKEDTFMLSELTYNIPDKNINKIVKKARDKSLLQVGKQVTISLVINEKDRLRLLLEKNGYNNIGNHAITFLIDTTMAKNSFAVQVNVDLQRKTLSLNNIDQKNNTVITTSSFNQETQHNYHKHVSPPAVSEQQVVSKI